MTPHQAKQRAERLAWKWIQKASEMTEVKLGDLDILTALIAAELLAVQRDGDKYRLALESLTPGGSEYVNDPERCRAWIQRVKDDCVETHKNLVRSRRENADLKAKLAAAEQKIVEDVTDYEMQINTLVRERETYRNRITALEEALRTALTCIEVQNMNTEVAEGIVGEVTVEAAIDQGFWCKLAIDARAAIKQALAPATERAE